MNIQEDKIEVALVKLTLFENLCFRGLFMGSSCCCRMDLGKQDFWREDNFRGRGS